MHAVLLVVHVFVALALVLIILLQRSEGGGLGLGGGGGGSGSFMSVRGTANLLTRTTAVLAGLFMISSLVLAMMAGNHGQGSLLDQMQPMPTATVPVPGSSAGNSVVPAKPTATPATPQVPLAK